MADMTDQGVRGALVHITVELVEVLERASLTDKVSFADELESLGRTIMEGDPEGERDPEALALAEVARVLREVAQG